MFAATRKVAQDLQTFRQLTESGVVTHSTTFSRKAEEG
jgi:hypothetical protein